MASYIISFTDFFPTFYFKFILLQKSSYSKGIYEVRDPPH